MAKKNQAAETATLVAQAAGGGETDAVQPGAQAGETADLSAGTMTTLVPDAPATAAPNPQASAQASGADAMAMLDSLSGQLAASPLSSALGERLSSSDLSGESSWTIDVAGAVSLGTQPLIAADSLAVVSPAVTKRVQARVLVDGRFGSVNSVVSVTEDELEAGKGELCAHPASVAYAKSL